MISQLFTAISVRNRIGDKYIGKKNSNKYLSAEMHMHFSTAKFEYIHCTAVSTKHATGYVLNPMGRKTDEVVLKVLNHWKVFHDLFLVFYVM